MRCAERTLRQICFEKHGIAWTQLIIEDAAHGSRGWIIQAITRASAFAKRRKLMALSVY